VAAAVGPDRERVARNGRLYVERYHDWGSNLSTMDDLLERMAGAADGDILQRAGTMMAVPG
jgi:hypothetical protein